MTKKQRPPPGEQTAPPAKLYSSQIEGREAEFGLSVAMVMRSLQEQNFYPHQVNDALVKLFLVMLQFAKNHNMWDETVAHDVKTMELVNLRLGQLIRDSGDREHALTGLVDDNSCHYQLVLETRSEPGKRIWKSPYGLVLEVCRRIGQFDLTEEEIHQRYTKPRLLGYAETMGVAVHVSDWSDDGMIVLEI